ncbi:hypothetical protein Kpol_1018p20 [Vanderwaltozyma polyspora DSM 70294]|uniref:Uncharacterized protein n=1 Tax=Vanderwaltozyma polyspora (strain ATCC 22028 / DSM 70294 / BCRC 21397 / CBS 2163 / NBRC 10782 / NRRL Y-8283 / UCD 57-17) TaxID=436907 RepID=A7TDM2_VANPO|nr:uncharacterized protein Kpol_1018p20 [Vanderwaltozyma polyspora DSM 70294]EDO19492.1 hypothetical protein Kpol_1018p20 [Vanderwaltozyma polyspora DSM 70294]
MVKSSNLIKIKLDDMYSVQLIQLTDVTRLELLYVSGSGEPVVVFQWECQNRYISRSQVGFDDKKKTLKVLWSFGSSIICDSIELPDTCIDSVEIGKRLKFNTEVVLEVGFNISYCKVIWISGIILICESETAILHIYDSINKRKVGNILMYSDDVHDTAFLYDEQTRSANMIVRKYDDLTKKTRIYLNCYSLTPFQLIHSYELPRGYSRYFFIDQDVNADDITGATKTRYPGFAICSTCDIMYRTVIQWIQIPTSNPWIEKTLNDYICERAIYNKLQVQLKVYKPSEKMTNDYSIATFNPLSIDQQWHFS